MSESFLSISKIHKRFGEEAIFRFGSQRSTSIPVIPTGIFALDVALGVGGIPRGRITEVFGPERSGKTTFCLSTLAQAQMLGDNVAFIDAEHDLDPRWAVLNGVDLDNLYLSQPDYGEMALETVEMLLDDFGCIVVDSVAALVPKAELEGDMGAAHMALQARLMSQAMRKLRGRIEKSKAAVIFTNQLRDRIGVMFGSPETTTGGNALKFYASVRLDFRKRADISVDKVIVGNQVEITVKKNKVSPPYKKAVFQILYASGIDKLSDLLEVCESEGVLKKGGSFSFEEGGEEKKVRGKEAIVEALISRPDLVRRLEMDLRIKLGLPLWEVIE